MNVGGADGVPLAARGRDRETAQQDLEEEVWVESRSGRNEALPRSATGIDDASVCPEFDAMHERYCGDLLNGVCAPRRGRMLACQVRRSATWVTRPWAFRGRFISRAMW